jgi:ADP-ribosyltransferase exoenzyme
LYKLPSVTRAEIKSNSELWRYRYNWRKPLLRHISIDNPERFITKYREALTKGEIIREPTFFATSVFRREYSFFSRRSNITYEIEGNLTGGGQATFVEKFKHCLASGEVLYPPETKFKVLQIIPPKKFDQQDGLDRDTNWVIRLREA